jgi:hypothetical protein
VVDVFLKAMFLFPELSNKFLSNADVRVETYLGQNVALTLVNYFFDFPRFTRLLDKSRT